MSIIIQYTFCFRVVDTLIDQIKARAYSWNDFTFFEMILEGFKISTLQGMYYVLLCQCLYVFLI